MSVQTEDNRLLNTIVEELAWDAVVDASQLNVTVSDSVVNIAGTLSSLAEKTAALHAVEAVAGVHDITVNIDVKIPPGTERSDADLDVMVEQTLTWDALVPEQDLTHRTEHAWVTLCGTVPTAKQRQEAERSVEHLLGFTGITNEIQIREPKLAPDAIRLAIGEALKRRAIHSARHIDIIIDGTKVTLLGSAQTPEEKRAILGTVTHAPGVDVVCDELKLRTEIGS